MGQLPTDYTPEDSLLYLDLTVHRGLQTLEGVNKTGKDKYGRNLPYGVGPHSVEAFRQIAAKVKPNTILEIGFNMGWSAALWIHFTNEQNGHITSIDISDKEETLIGAEVLTRDHPGRFEFILSDSKKVYNQLKDRSFDMIFIDGDHNAEGVMADMKLAKDLKIKNVVLDDWLPEYGPGVQPSAKKFGIIIDEVYHNIALGHFPE